jgi:hypothetical protein
MGNMNHDPGQHGELIGVGNIMGYDHTMYNAPNQVIDVVHEPTPPKCACTPGNCDCGMDCGCMCCYGNGPGGRTTNVQYNEKGILETGLHHLIGMHTQADLCSQHDSLKRGIYPEYPDYD